MQPHEWMESAKQSWGVTFRANCYVNPREALLRYCEIKGDCWVSSKPYVVVGTKRVLVQRAAYGLFQGPIHERDEVIPTCGNKRCCWAGHLHLVPRETIAKAKQERLSASNGGATYAKR